MMNVKNRFVAPLALLAVAALPMLTNGCDPSEVQDAVCCSAAEFTPGATVKIEGSAQSQVFVQASADFAGVASAAIGDLTTACRSIAQDLDADAGKQSAAEAQTDNREKMKAWCELAVSAITTVKGNAQLTVDVVPPQCSASISAKANCQAKCSVDGKCDIKANPPKCTGGKLEVACKGGCTAEAGASVQCEGSCTGSCEGSCTAQGGVECSGKCEGTCEAGGQAGGTGIQADGTCKGVCKGTCSVTPPGVTCSGSCNGSCSATCQGSAEASVKCDGKCDADYEPLKCEGGKLEGGCQVDAKCDANCDASVSAKAECTPPSVTVNFSADGAAFGKLKSTLEANLPLVFGIKARFEGLAQVGGTLTANADAVVDIKAACIPAVLAALATAGQDVTATVSATGSLVGSVGGS